MLFDFQHSVTDVIKVVNYHNCYFAQNVAVIITVTAVHPLFVLQSLSGWAGNVLSASLVRLVGEFLNTQFNSNWFTKSYNLLEVSVFGD